jgi:hypothetical protein
MDLCFLAVACVPVARSRLHELDLSAVFRRLGLVLGKAA